MIPHRLSTFLYKSNEPFMHFIEQPKHIFNNTRKLNKEIFYWNNKNNSQNFLATLSSWVAVVPDAADWLVADWFNTTTRWCPLRPLCLLTPVLFCLWGSIRHMHRNT